MKFSPLILLLALTAAHAEVPLWGQFETSITNAQSYSDPVRNVTLRAFITKPDNSEVAAFGFWDGGTVWKFRYMPDQLGQWSYTLKFSDGSASAAGTFEVVPSQIPGRLTVLPDNKKWFGYPNGDHELIRSFHVGDKFFAKNWDDPNVDSDGNPRDEFLDWFQSQGYNTLSIASYYLNRNVSGRGLGWDTPSIWPIDPEEFRWLETILEDLAARRIFVYPSAGFFGRNSNFPTDTEDQEIYVRYITARIGPYWNQLLNVAGPESLGNLFTQSEIHRLGQLIAANNTFDHLLSVHEFPEDTYFRNASWSTYITFQGYKRSSPQAVYDGLVSVHSGIKPVYAQEVFWAGNSLHQDFSPDEARRKAIAMLMAAVSINFGDMDGNSSSGFSGSLDLADRRQTLHDEVKRAWDIFERFDLWGHESLPILC